MFTATLYGTPACHRYQKMRKLILDEAARLNLPILLDEVSETAQLVLFSPISLPRLYINGQMIASQDPPRVERITKILAQDNP